jgi:hypothetical protein
MQLEIDALRLAAKTLRAVASLPRTRKSFASELREAADLNDSTANALEQSSAQSKTYARSRFDAARSKAMRGGT